VAAAALVLPEALAVLVVAVPVARVTVKVAVKI
jgi:hypothetical protein